MKITTLELFKVPPRWLFLRIGTDEGLVGWGEPVVEGRAETVKTAVEELSTYLIGQDPGHIEDLWQVLFRGGFYRGGPVHMSAIAGIDQALWDLKGKALGVPVYELLGGPVRDRIEVYSWIGGDDYAGAAASVRERQAAGYRSVKMSFPGPMHYVDSRAKVDAAVGWVQAVRDTAGPQFGIAVDFHGRAHRAMAKILVKELEPLHPMFIEEPVLSENLEGLREVARHTSTPIALGERLFSRWDFKRILEEGLVDIVQPDPSHAGGITEIRKIAAMAEAYDVALAPHCPLGPLCFAAALQIDALSPNAVIQEQSLEVHAPDALYRRYLKNPDVFAFEAGSVLLPTGPGLGLEVDEEAVREAAGQGHDWRNPVLRNPDGTIAEW